MKYFGGVEGGATHSKLIICDENGKCITYTTGFGTNHWMIGIKECCKRIADMVDIAKNDAGIPNTTRLTSIGLSLSGCEQEATNKELENELKTSYPNLSDNYVVCSDTVGSIFTASQSGGLVLISGTGSNALLRNPDGTTYGCGGWGHFLGDEGSAWWISYYAIKIVYNDMDNFEKSSYPIHRVWELIKHHFNVDTRLDLLDYCYAKFDKSYFASLCKKLAHLAEEGDELCLHLFKESGRMLAKFVKSLLPKVHNNLLINNNLNIVCVGSVWLSWNLLCEGFLKELSSYKLQFNLKLITITKTMAYGAVYLAADAVLYDLPRNYEDNYKVFYHYKQNQEICYDRNGSTR